MPVPYLRGKTVKWQHTFSFGDKEKEVIKKFMEKDFPCLTEQYEKFLSNMGK